MKFIKSLPWLICLALLCLGSPVYADQFITENLIVTGNSCIGFDCSNGENLDDTTLKLKENNLRILFDDTDTDAADWWLTANDSVNSGSSFFSISDEEVSHVIETVSLTSLTDSAANNSLTLYEGGRVYKDGSGNITCYDTTSTPFVVVTCPETVDYETTTVAAGAQDFVVDPGTNSFHITETAVMVGTSDATRIVSNVSAGVENSDVINMSQLNNAQDSLTAIEALGDDEVAGTISLATALDAIEGALPAQTSAITSLQARIVTTETTISPLETELSAQQTRLGDLNTELTNVDTDKETAASTVAANTAALNTQQMNLGNLSSDIASNSSAIINLQQAVGNLAATGSGETGSATAEGSGSTAFGVGAAARTLDTAIGYQATVSADGSVAVGANTVVDSTNSVAAGADAEVATEASGSSAIGQNSSVARGATAAVAVGQNAQATEANSVSVGSETEQRRITNVASATRDSDAINFAQLQQLSNLVSNQHSRIAALDDRVDRVGAVTAALSALVPNLRSGGKVQASFGLGHYSGRNAVAAGLFCYLSERVLISGGVSSAFETDSTVAQTGLSITW